MKKFAFLTEPETLSECLGISPERNKEIVKACRVALAESDSSVVEVMEIALNRLQPKNEVEAMYIGFVIKSAIYFQSPAFLLHTLLERKFNQE